MGWSQFDAIHPSPSTADMNGSCVLLCAPWKVYVPAMHDKILLILMYTEQEPNGHASPTTRRISQSSWLYTAGCWHYHGPGAENPCTGNAISFFSSYDGVSVTSMSRALRANELVNDLSPCDSEEPRLLKTPVYPGPECTPAQAGVHSF